MFHWLFNFNFLIILICVHEILSDDPQLESYLQKFTEYSKLSNSHTNPMDQTFTKGFNGPKFTEQSENENNNKEMETFYQKISQQLQNHEENLVSSSSDSQNQSTVPQKSADRETNNKTLVKPSVRGRSSESRSNPLHSLLVSMKRIKDSKINNRLPNNRAMKHFRPTTKGMSSPSGISYAADPGDRTFMHAHPYNRLKRDINLVERRPPRQKGGPRHKPGDDKRSFHFQLVLRKNRTTHKPNPKLEKLKHPANLHVLRKRAAIMDADSAEIKPKQNMGREKKIYLEHNEILDDEDAFAEYKMWSSDLAKDKLNFYEKKIANGFVGLADEHESIRNASEGVKKQSVSNQNNVENETIFGSTTIYAENEDQSKKEKCGNPNIFSYRYYWCRAKNVFRNFVKLFKSK